MAKHYHHTLSMTKIATEHLLVGLAKSYRELDRHPDLQFEMRTAIEWILRTLEREKVDIFKKRSPFYTYVQLINYESLNS